MKKMWNQIGWPRPPAVNEIKTFDNDDKAAKHSERKIIIMHRYNFLATNPIPILFRWKMANSDTNTDTLVCKHYSQETVCNFNTILIASCLNAFASLFTTIETKALLVGFWYGFNKIFMASTSGLLPMLMLFTDFFQGFMVYH